MPCLHCLEQSKIDQPQNCDSRKVHTKSNLVLIQEQQKPVITFKMMGDNTSKLYKLNKTSTTAPEYFSNHNGGLPIPVSLFIFALHRRRISFHFCQEPRWNFFARPCRPARDFPKKSDISELCAKKLYFCKRMYSARLLSQCYRAFNCRLVCIHFQLWRHYAQKI